MSYRLSSAEWKVLALEEPEQFLLQETGNQTYKEPEQFLFQKVGNQIYKVPEWNGSGTQVLNSISVGN